MTASTREIYLMLCAAMETNEYGEPPHGSEPIEIPSLEPDEALFERVPALEQQLQQTG